jgi:hypothetical protein
MNEVERQAVAAKLYAELNLDDNALVESGALSLLSPAQIRQLWEGGMDVQLHSYSHVLPPDSEGIRAQIVENRQHLQPCVDEPLRHFCDPTAKWRPEYLAAEDVISNTTCDTGLNDAETPLLSLKRFLDSAKVFVLNLRPI